MVLEHAPELRHAAPRQAGLFHTAILFETEADLSAAVYAAATRNPGSFTGSADHLVSKAFYFTDPEGNGVELYWDRDRTEWSWAHGRVEMATLMLDPNRYLAEHLDESAMAHAHERPAKVGHVHLCVGDIPGARRFYVDQLGFETTAELGDQALFVSAGRYHHHMAMNTWTSAGAGRRRLALGLGLVRIELPGVDDLGALESGSATTEWPPATTAAPSASTTPGSTGSRSRSRLNTPWAVCSVTTPYGGGQDSGEAAPGGGLEKL